MNSVVLYLLSLIWVGKVVFGNAIVTPVVGIIFTGFLLTAITHLTQPVLRQLKIKISNENNLTLAFLVVNIVGVWILARLVITGFGIAVFWVAIILGIILTAVQWVFWKFVVQKLKTK